MGLEEYLPNQRYVSRFKFKNWGDVYKITLDVEMPHGQPLEKLQESLLKNKVPIRKVKSWGRPGKRGVEYCGKFPSSALEYSIRVLSITRGDPHTLVNLRGRNYSKSTNGMDTLMQAIRDYVIACEKGPEVLLDLKPSPDSTG